MAFNQQDAAQKVMASATAALENLTAKQPKSSVVAKEKGEDEVFAELVSKMLEQIPESDAKDTVKLNIQQLLIQTKYQLSRRTYRTTPDSSLGSPPPSEMVQNSSFYQVFNQQ